MSHCAILLRMVSSALKSYVWILFKDTLWSRSLFEDCQSCTLLQLNSVGVLWAQHQPGHMVSTTLNAHQGSIKKYLSLVTSHREEQSKKITNKPSNVLLVTTKIRTQSQFQGLKCMLLLKNNLLLPVIICLFLWLKEFTPFKSRELTAKVLRKCHF